MYNTQQFDHNDFTTEPIIYDSVVDHFEINYNKKYQIDSKIIKGAIGDKTSLFTSTENEFYEFHVGDMKVTRNPQQEAYRG